MAGDVNADLFEELGSQVTVSGAGGVKGKLINGKYDIDGTHNGRNKYKQMGSRDNGAVKNSGTVFFDQFWRISCDDNLDTCEYKNVTGLEAELVPEEWWSAVDPAQLPAPSVTDEWLKRHGALKIFRRLHPTKLVEHVPKILKLLSDSKDMVRLEAVEVLGRLQHQELENIIGSITDLIQEEPKENVREAAIKVIGKLDAVDILKHTQQICDIMCDDESNFVRLWAMNALSKLDIDELGKFESQFEKKLSDSYMPCREKAAQLLRNYRIKTGTLQDDQ